MKTNLLALALAASLIAGPAVAQQSSTDSSTSANGLPAHCAEIGPALDEETISAIKDLNERRQALSCMVGTPRDYSAELSSRSQSSQPKAVNVEEAFGTDVVAEGLEQSAEAIGENRGDLQMAVNEDRTLSDFLRQEGYHPVEVIGYAITPNVTYLYLAPTWSEQELAEIRQRMDQRTDDTQTGSVNTSNKTDVNKSKDATDAATNN